MVVPIKVLIPAAGRGTRVAAFGGGRPKELIRVGPRTMIEWCLAMVAASGVRDVGLVIRPGKENVARAAQNFWAGEGMAAPLTVLYQDPPQGVADAMKKAQAFTGADPLAVIMPDNLLVNGPPALEQMLAVYQVRPMTTIGALALTPDQAKGFGNVGRMVLDSSPAPAGMPARVIEYAAKRPGVLALPGQGLHYKGFMGVVYNPEWVRWIGALTPNFQGEYDDADLVSLLQEQGRLQAAVLEGRGFDLGNERGLQAARSFFT
jgi:dTDP-glucose pyrophosphorylase